MKNRSKKRNYKLTGNTLTPENENSYLTLDNSTVKLTDRDNNIIEETFTGNDGSFSFIVYSAKFRYEESYEGRKLKHSDEMVKYRAQLRKKALAEKAHLGYNPILGEQAYPIPEALKPMPFTEQPPPAPGV